MTANIIAGIAVLVAIGAAIYARLVDRRQTRALGRRLQKQDHKHVKSLQLQQQDHERQIRAFETQVQQRIARLTAEMVKIERSRRAEENDRARAAKLSAATANLTMTITGLPHARPQLEIVNSGPTAAKNIELKVCAQLEPMEGIRERLPELLTPERLWSEFPAASSQRLEIELFGGRGAEIEWSWEDKRPGRQTVRRALRRM